MELPLDTSSVRVGFDMEEVKGISLDLLRSLEAEDVEVPLAAVALALSIGRLLSPDALADDQSAINFVQGLMEWSAVYFADGGIN